MRRLSPAGQNSAYRSPRWRLIPASLGSVPFREHYVRPSIAQGVRSVLVGPEDVARGARVADGPRRLEVTERQRNGAVRIQALHVVDRSRRALDGDQPAIRAAAQVPFWTGIGEGFRRVQQLEERHGHGSLASAAGGEQAHQKYIGHERKYAC